VRNGTGHAALAALAPGEPVRPQLRHGSARARRPAGHREPIAAVPGYAGGLAFHRGLAFVGLSKIRETATFGGAPIAAYQDQLKCGVGVIELSTGNTAATLQFAKG
jgi:hypothetical protein